MSKASQLRYPKARLGPRATPSRPKSSLCSMMQRTTFALIFGVGLLALFNPGVAEPPSLDGSWRGYGALSFAWGSTEHARCRADYSRTSETSYTVKAVCITASARAAQTAILRKVGENRYKGSFHNRQYDVSGTIQIVVRGDKQAVILESTAASASFTLRRSHDASVAAGR
jgi:hypothetical protein